MCWTETLNRLRVPRDAANARMWTGSPGHYEVWYATLNARAQGLGLWFRETIDAPASGPASFERWVHVFDASSPERSFGLKQRVNALEWESGRIRGRLANQDHQVSWDLAFEPPSHGVHLVPFPMRVLGIAKTRVVLCSPNAQFSGAIAIDGREVSIAGEPGGQSHLWGTRHAERWTWGHCNAWDEGQDCVIDGVAAFPGKLPRPLTALYVRHRGEDYFLNALPGALLAASDVRFPSWSFSARARGLRFEGRFDAPPDRFLQVEYRDPDGTPSYCANTEIAGCVLEIWQGARLVERLSSRSAAHVEFGARTPWLGVRRTVSATSP